MKYIKFTYVDAVTGTPITDAPAINGPAFPAVDGLEFVWARESQYPTAVPEFFGTCPDESFFMAPGVIDVLSQADWNRARDEEMSLRVARVIKLITDSTQHRLDSWAKTRNYDDVQSLCSYATSSIPKFATEGQRGVDNRDQTWATLYTIMDEVEAGERPMPAGYADIEPLLPALEWPAP